MASLKSLKKSIMAGLGRVMNRELSVDFGCRLVRSQKSLFSIVKMVNLILIMPDVFYSRECWSIFAFLRSLWLLSKFEEGQK